MIDFCNLHDKSATGAGHVLAPATTGCIDDFVRAEYVPEYLDVLESWLSNKSR